MRPRGPFAAQLDLHDTDTLHGYRTEAPKSKNRKPVNKDRFVSKMCASRCLPASAVSQLADGSPPFSTVLRGDSVVLGEHNMCPTCVSFADVLHRSQFSGTLKSASR